MLGSAIATEACGSTRASVASAVSRALQMSEFLIVAFAGRR
jgi:hypothetical protein